jgi:His-Xaa-Ser system radical SAM maturase HxsC
MKTLPCKTVGFERPILVRVTSLGVPKRNRADNALLWSGDQKPDAKGYSAVIVEQSKGDLLSAVSKKIPLALIDRTSELAEGDVVLVDPTEQTVRVLYDTRSGHNAILVTERCNSQCIMCPQPPSTVTDEHRTALILRLIDLMAPGPRSLALTGGEPTLLGDDLLLLIRKCLERLPDTCLHLLTNGRLFRRRAYVEKCAELRHPRLTVAVPLYADTDTEHDRIVGRPGAFHETIEGLHNLALYGFLIEIRVVVLSLNSRRLVRLSEYLYRNLPFVAHVAFMGMETEGLAQVNLDTVWVDQYDYQDELQEACRYLWRRSVPVSIYNHQLCVLPHIVWPIARQSISTWKNIFLPVCGGCSVKLQCAGFFASAAVRHSSHISPVIFSSGGLTGPGVRT